MSLRIVAVGALSIDTLYVTLSFTKKLDAT